MKKPTLTLDLADCASEFHRAVAANKAPVKLWHGEDEETEVTPKTVFYTDLE